MDRVENVTLKPCCGMREFELIPLLDVCIPVSNGFIVTHIINFDSSLVMPTRR